jgi:hypothetical protein
MLKRIRRALYTLDRKFVPTWCAIIGCADHWHDGQRCCPRCTTVSVSRTEAKALLALTDELRRQRELREATAKTANGVMAEWIADVITGQRKGPTG